MKLLTQRTPRLAASIVLFVAIVSVLTSARAADLESVLHKAIRNYAPDVYLHPAEKYLPTSAEKLLEVAKPTLAGGLRLKNSDPGPWRAGNLAAATAYVNVKISVEHTDAQFWFLYAYNGPGTVSIGLFGRNAADFCVGSCGVHEGDWEHVTLRIRNRDGRLLAVYLAQHSGGEWIEKPEKLMNHQRLAVFSSLNGHACYATTGRNYSESRSLMIGEFRLVNATARGPRFDTQARFRIIAAHDLRPSGKTSDAALLAALGGSAPEWMKYRARWGVEQSASDAAHNLLANSLPNVFDNLFKRVGGAKLFGDTLERTSLAKECFGQAGPVPPWSKASWIGEE
jgi:hypothetical protein